ncbi:MAG: phospho-sugar mutase [Oscillospiraceae bacterium]|nr:phospho-sugar mutase [Oscillospiraceae bacterium]
MMMNAQQSYAAWLQLTDADTVRALRAMEHDQAAIAAHFGAPLTFGTAGIRGLMGPGLARMNVYTVRRTARGLGRFLLSGELAPRCAIGYDCRHNSRLFAETCAAALAEIGVTVYLFDRLCPTPMVSFAIRHLGCGCGMVISASHNARDYNGLKCYGADGCQMTARDADAVLACIDETDLFEPAHISFADSLHAGRIQMIGQAVWEAYYQAVLSQGVHTELPEKAALKVVYSPLCGAGGEPVREVLGRLGVTLHEPASQAAPSGDFATCPSPNPENEAAFDEAYKLAETVQPDLILATDPDSDRIAASVPVPGGFHKLSGNDMGCLLMDYLLNALGETGTRPSKPVMVKSIVSTPMADEIAKAYGVELVTVLTGFKYIGEAILSLEKQGRAGDFVLGFEESCGYLKGAYARDKDGVEAAMLICEMTAAYKLQRITLLDRLAQLQRKYGFFDTRLENINFTSDAQKAACLGFMDKLRAAPPAELAGIAVRSCADFASGVVTDLPAGETHDTGLPRENMVQLNLSDRARVILRPSGTEPKIKLYYAGVGASMEETDALLDRVMDAVRQRMEE